MLTISKDNSTIIKGIAISMMLACHLFNANRIDLYTSLLYVGDKPFAQWILKACGPVGFFMLLSGYGLSYKYSHGGLSFKTQLIRILRLYIHYWIVLAIFLTIGHIMMPERYPGGLQKLLVRLTAWDSSNEMWFLIPYAITSVLSPYIIKIISKVGNLWSLIATIIIYLASNYVISRHGNFFYPRLLLYEPLLTLHLLMTFTMGVVLHRTTINLDQPIKQWVVLIAIAAAVITICSAHLFGFYIIYLPLMVILFTHVKWPKFLRIALLELGRKSMPMWMIHMWFASYLFQSQVYALRYPILIFLGLTVASYLLSIPVMWIADRINRFVPKLTKI